MQASKFLYKNFVCYDHILRLKSFGFPVLDFLFYLSKTIKKSVLCESPETGMNYSLNCFVLMNPNLQHVRGL